MLRYADEKSGGKLTSTEKKEFYRELFSLAIPIGLQNLLIALIGATDALMLGRLSQDAVAAVSLANQIVFVMNLFTGTVVSAGGALIAQYWGKEDRTTVKNLFCMILKWSFGISFVFFALAMFIPGLLMRIYTPETALIEIGASYLRAVSISYLFSGITQCYYLKMKIEGKASKSVIISAVTLITDVILDMFLIYGLAGVPKLGANGSAYSTVVVELIGLVWCIAESRRKDSIRPDWQGIRWFSPVITKDFMKLALPMLGRNLFDKAKVYGRKLCHISFWVGGIHMALLCAIGPALAYFFVLTETARYYLIMMLLFMVLYVFAYSINTVVVCGIFPAGGDARYDAVSVFFATWCFSLPMALLGAFVFDWPVMAVYILMCADEVVKLPWLYPRYKKYLWVNNRTREKT